ncbi:MAG: hypothetical protein KDK33_04210 [Leptospiraceae bacterium]|nr:hypothetical protein [Leptospiraceae bacterium]
MERPGSGRHTNLYWVPTLTSAFLSLYCIFRAFAMRWVCDDAFISFRYASNAWNGLGLVFNAGEYVEGYTNFLWTVLMIPASAFDVAPEVWSWALSLLSLCALLGFLTVRLFVCKDLWPLFVVLFLASNFHFQVFATSGLETMAFTVASFLGLYLACIGSNSNLKSGIGILFLLISCTLRPDGLIFLGCGWLWNAWQWWARRTRVRLAILLFPVLCLLTYEAWRLCYYGEWLPNTFYAKSAYDSYFAQGLLYLGLFYSSYWFILPIILLCGFMGIRASRPQGFAALLIAVLFWHAYVIWIGGDFMFGRFLVPILPILYCICGISLERFALVHTRLCEFFSSRPRTGRIGLSLGCLIILGALEAVRFDPYHELAKGSVPQISGIVEESRFYQRSKMQELAALARSYKSIIRESRVRLAFHGAAAFLIYYMDPVYALEASTGLTDARLARRRLDKRGRIGHEKEATLDYMRERKVNVYMWPPDADQADRKIVFQGFWDNWQIVTYDSKVFRTLKKDPRIQFQFTGK